MRLDVDLAEWVKYACLLNGFSQSELLNKAVRELKAQNERESKQLTALILEADR